MISAIVAVLVFALVVSLIVVYARDAGPTPVDIALSYELAWDRLDFDTLYTLSAPEMRDGLDKPSFIAAKRTAYGGRHELRNLLEHIDVEHVDVGTTLAVVRTRVTLRDGSHIQNDVTLVRRSAAWSVTGYQLVPTPPQPV